MNFELTKEQALLKKAAQQFAENTLEPTAAELDETHVFPVENFKQMARYGFTGIGVPKEYGGVGGGMTEEVIAVSEFAKITRHDEVVVLGRRLRVAKERAERVVGSGG